MGGRRIWGKERREGEKRNSLSPDAPVDEAAAVSHRKENGAGRRASFFGSESAAQPSPSEGVSTNATMTT